MCPSKIIFIVASITVFKVCAMEDLHSSIVPYQGTIWNRQIQKSAPVAVQTTTETVQDTVQQHEQYELLKIRHKSQRCCKRTAIVCCVLMGIGGCIGLGNWVWHDLSEKMAQLADMAC
jgi:hypothetical protein